MSAQNELPQIGSNHEQDNSPSQLLESVIVAEITARTVLIRSRTNSNMVAGAGCVIDSNHILTTRQAIEASQPDGQVNPGATILFSLASEPERLFKTEFIQWNGKSSPENDLISLRGYLEANPSGRPVEFVSCLKYEGKSFATFNWERRQLMGGFFVGEEDKEGHVAMPVGESRISHLLAGAPVWSSSLNAFAGLVAFGPSDSADVYCLTGRRLCRFFPGLPVQFKIPKNERPKIKNFSVDDPNVDWFGNIADDGKRKLSATLEPRDDEFYSVKLIYQMLPGSPPPRGRFVTFLTYPDMDEYEIIAELDATGKAEVECRPMMPDFTAAAIGDGGDTRLTFDLDKASRIVPLKGGAKESATASGKIASQTNEPEQKISGEKKVEVKKTAHDPGASGQSIVPRGYTTGLTGFSSEYCGIGGNGEVKDQLKVEEFAKRLAELIAARETKLPLAVGLFGNWGSGKSYFMNLVDQHFKKLTKETKAESDKRIMDGSVVVPDPNNEGPWCREIVPVYFNAWHYVDSNLWASLVSQIFESLFAHLRPKKDEFQKVQELLEQASGTTARATEELAIAQQEAARAKTELRVAKTAREQQDVVMEGLLEGLKTLLPDVRNAEVRKKTAVILGTETELQTFDELQKVVADAKTLTGQLKTFWNSFWGSGWKWRLGWLVMTGASIYFGPKLLMEWFAKGRPLLANISALIAPVLSLMVVAITKGKAALAKIESWEARAREVRERKLREDPVIKAAEQKAQATQAREQAALLRVAEADAKQKQLQEEAANLAPERRIARFIEQRAQSSDYRGQLGLVSMARRDFEELSNMFTNKKMLKEHLEQLKKVQDAANSKGKESEANAAKDEAEKIQKTYDSIDRIVLFVDDLDRCQPNKVVDVLQAVHLLLAFPLFSVIVGVDQRCLRQSLHEQFKGLLTPSRRNGVSQNRSFSASSDERPATPLDYLEKIFHIPFHLPPMEKAGFDDLIEYLTKPTEGEVVVQKKAERKTLPASTSTIDIKSKLSTTNAASVEPESFEFEQSGHKPDGVLFRATVTEVEEDKPAPAAEIEAQKEENPEASKVIGSVPLERWERDAFKDYNNLIQTPRGATRMLNTYRLVRAGVPAEDWNLFCGDTKNNGEFRIALLLLAASAGCPAVARGWFERLRSTDPNQPMEQTASDTTPSNEWTAFKELYENMMAGLNQKPTKDRLEIWLRRVERYTF